MGKAGVSFDEIRFDVRDPELTHVYVFCRMTGDAPDVGGWRHKTFPFTMSTLGIHSIMFMGEGPLAWDRGAP